MNITQQTIKIKIVNKYLTIGDKPVKKFIKKMKTYIKDYYNLPATTKISISSIIYPTSINKDILEISLKIKKEYYSRYICIDITNGDILFLDRHTPLKITGSIYDKKIDIESVINNANGVPLSYETSDDEDDGFFHL